MCTGASFAELASMYPTAGGQYHYVHALSSKNTAKPLSWIAGWISVFGWQSLAASAPFLAGTMIQGLLVLSDPTYAFQRWHGTLFYWAVILIATLINVFGAKLLPAVENVSMVFHVTLFFVMLLVLVIMTPEKHSASFVFTEFVNNSGWNSDGVAWCIGLLSSCYVFVGPSSTSTIHFRCRN